MKGGKSECFQIESAVRHGCIMFPWLFNLCMDGVIKEVKLSIGRIRVRFLEEGR